MKWKNNNKNKNKDSEQQNQQPKQTNIQKKQSVSSTTSMPFLRDDNLTFHRFTTDVSLDSSRRPSSDKMYNTSQYPSGNDDGGGGGGGGVGIITTSVIDINDVSSPHKNSSSNGGGAIVTTTPTTLQILSSNSNQYNNHNQHQHNNTAFTINGNEPSPAGAATIVNHNTNNTSVWTTNIDNNQHPHHQESPSLSMQRNINPMVSASGVGGGGSNNHGSGIGVANIGNYNTKYSYTKETNDFHYIPSNGSSVVNDKSIKNGSTAKLMAIDDDQANKQSKCSLFRGVIFCLCLNFTYANIVRFPRELERHGVAFLIPYFTILLLIGLPIVLLEISLGQFLGQGSASSWRASPILKGASIVGRFASWLLAIWTSLQAVIAILYIGELIFKAVPFPNCASKVHLDATTGYIIEAQSGQECLQQTFLTPVWDQSLYFLLLTVSLVVIWIIAMLCTYSSKTLRRSIFFIGLVSLILLALQSGWNVADFINKNDTNVGTVLDMFTFDLQILADSQIWFDALCQVIYSTGIGFGMWPVLTGKFLYKGDAVRTSMVYMCFNILIILLSVTFFATQFNKTIPMNSTILLPELKPLTSIYDAALYESNLDPLLARIIPGLAYLLIVLVSISTIAISIYTTSRFFGRHPNYIMSICGLIISITALLAPNYLVSRVLDSQIVGIFVICALIFDILSITWIYGAKNIYTDLEFSIGRPILKSWVFMWCIIPVVLTGLLFWWSSIFLSIDLTIITIPRWTPIIFSLTIIILVACIEVYQQVDYNCCSMIQEAAQSSTDWGPADPIVRHAWKQWRSVCEDTGQKDFTLRRRGTRDYTHSIKKGQYSRNNNNNNQHKYGTNNIRKTSSTGGSNSPNYSGSIFEDSAIEEDVSVGKYGGFQRQASSEGRRSTSNPPQPSPISINGHVSRNKHQHQQQQLYGGDGYSTNDESRRISATSDIVDHGQNKQYFYVSSAPHNIDSNEYNQHQQQQQQHHSRQHNNVSKIDITSGHSINVAAVTTGSAVASPHVQPKKSFSKNPLGRISTEQPSSYGSEGQDIFPQINTASVNGNNNYGQNNRKQIFRDSGGVGGSAGGAGGGDMSVAKNGGSLTTSNNLSPDHICWRKFSVNSEEFSTEL